MRVPGGTSPTEVSYLRAYVLEQVGRSEDAVKAYLEIPDGRNEYYGGRATERLRALAADEKARAAVASRLDSLRKEAQQATREADQQCIDLAATLTTSIHAE